MWLRRVMQQQERAGIDLVHCVLRTRKVRGYDIHAGQLNPDMRAAALKGADRFGMDPIRHLDIAGPELVITDGRNLHDLPGLRDAIQREPGLSENGAGPLVYRDRQEKALTGLPLVVSDSGLGSRAR